MGGDGPKLTSALRLVARKILFCKREEMVATVFGWLQHTIL
jgi:hypothetical protein